MARQQPALHVISSPASADAPVDPRVPRVSETHLCPTPADLDLETLFRRYASYVAAVAYRLLGRDDEVDDTVQEVFLAAVRGIASVRDPGAVKGWLARVTVRVARRRLQKRRMLNWLGLSDASAYERVADSSADAEQKALLSRVYRVLDRMPSSQRLAWSLRYIEGEPLEQVATLLGCSLATAKRRIAAAAVELTETFADG